MNTRPLFTKSLKIGSFFVAIDYAPYLIAKSKGLFEKIDGGTSAKYTMFQSLPPMDKDSFATNQIDAVFEAEPPALIGSAAGIDVKIVGISCSLIQEILVPVKSKEAIRVRRSQGFQNRRSGRHSWHYGVLKLLKEAGVTPNSVEIIDITHARCQECL